MNIYVYAVGPVSASVCAPTDLPIQDVAKQLNDLHPTGIDSEWTVSDEPTFSGGEPNPCPCNADPGRVHRLFHC